MVDHFHKVGFMGEDNAWNVIRENMFKGDPCPSQLVSAGKMIARWRVPNCIEVVSGILADAASEYISENIKFAASDYGNRQSRILSLPSLYILASSFEAVLLISGNLSQYKCLQTCKNMGC